MQVAILIMLVLAMIASPIASRPTPVCAIEFVADQTIRAEGRVHRSSLYYRDDMWRIEHNDPGSVDITIVRKDKGLIWLLIGRMRQFATLPFDDSTDVMLDRTLVNESGRELIGTEILDGHPTAVYQVSVQNGEQVLVYYQWWADDIQLPLRLARQDGAWVVQYKNVRLRPVSSSFFELPLNYRPVETQP
ncbi:conserved exported protein of unknown function [Nitrospira japonica]|uniref:DUF4178 domain-containing protein n=1 Tax=Nitrospira japonica TaxID=1325564 RepID=A0A1W1I2T8_9BACT|nr:hypothetical protein [Nitrospira japonica]SLM47285.1 conserved exported protein of unknown function [Nitrospira japonica]